MNRSTRQSVRRVLTIFVLAAILGFGRNILFPGGVAFQSKEPAAGSTDSLALQIDLRTGYRLYRDGMTFIDARAVESYRAGHIPGALSLPAGESFQRKLMLADSLNPQQTYVIYCNDSSCPLGEEVYQFLQVAGFQSLHLMYEGFDGWKQAGYPVTAGGEN